MERRCNGGETEVQRRWNGGATEVQRRCNGSATEVQRKCNGGATEVQRRCYMGALDIIRAVGGRIWSIDDVLSGYGDERSLRTGESIGGFWWLAENNGQAGGLTYGVGTMALVCLGRLFQPLIWCRVRISDSLAWPTGGTRCQSTAVSHLEKNLICLFHVR